MAIGYFLRVGDRTTCGGQILTGDNTMQWYGVAGAREGDMVSCGKHSGAYRILGGVNSVWLEDRKHAGTLESFSSCPCHARFINSIQDCYSDESGAASPETASTIFPAITNKICISCLMKAGESGQMLVVREG
ncbi:PAAR domain-containing protein [Providencia rettgeri]|uniref:PAAR domain-containing protein n=1 Tax=Providencia TaxID=586 RepID=UPI0018C556CD|nr:MULTISPECIES: PAAR domain-containing protein [Providencia]MBG5929839.1 PAAR domain-containing protein [Providencia rettgeri]MBS0859322.1 PAAR domain-containing protein [Providencia rettgeri]MBS0873335.1 PAAR domain-containing protein [Providencia rettgeri]MBS0920370.1 PAAR domain-containing protein [Providencia rettgeri]MCG5371266.1 PAAR domain-containing protein [Providencia rettgeri]